MFEKIRWSVFLAAAYALFALTAVIIGVSAWAFLTSTGSKSLSPKSFSLGVFRPFLAPILITSAFAYWHLARFRRTGHRSAMVETGVSIIGAVSAWFVVSLFLRGA